MPSSSKHLSTLAQLCSDAALPSARRFEHEAALVDLLSSPANTKVLVRMLERALEPAASPAVISDGIRAAIASDVLSERRLIPVAERQRIDELATIALTSATLTPRDRALALAAQAKIKVAYGAAEDALAAATSAEQLVMELDDHAALFLINARRGLALAFLARTEESLSCYERAAHHASACGDARAHIASLQDQANALGQLGRAAESHSIVEEALLLARAVGDRAGEMRSHAAVAYGHLELLHFEKSRDAYAAALAIGDTGVAPRLRAVVIGYSALLHLQHDHLDRALAQASRAVAECAKLGFRAAEGFFAAVQATAHARAGDFAAAEDRIRFARALVPEGHAYVAVVRLFEACIEVEQQSPTAFEEARALLDEVSLPQPGEERALVERLDDARAAARILRRIIDGQRASLPELEPEARALLRRLDARRLVALLRARKGRVVSAREVAAHVWPGDAPSDDAARSRIDELLASDEGSTLAADVTRNQDGYQHG